VRVIDDLLEAPVPELVAIFEGAIILRVFLHGIIGQVDILVVDVGEVDLELTGGGPQVALLENVQLMVLVDQNPDPDVKFPIVE
jgi:hypothetical protein